MDTFLMVCMVAADFYWQGEIFQVKPEKIGMFINAPTWIKKTLMYQWLLKDGSIKIGLDKEAQKKIENDPMEGISPEGKAEEVTEAAEKELTAGDGAAEEEKKPERKSATRKSKKGEDK